MQKDFKTALFIGFLAALVWIPVLRNLSSRFSNELWALLVIIPIASALGLYTCNILFHRIKFFYRFAKYVIVGFLSAGVDFAIFNAFIYLTGVERGAEIALFKAVSFSGAMLVSYHWNKIWTFGSIERGGGAWYSRQFFRLAAVTIIGVTLNVGLTSLIINFISPPFGFTQLVWDNVAAAAAIIVNVIWNFAGYKIIVFKSPDSAATALDQI